MACASQTGGMCQWFGCDKFRNATCDSNYDCVCEAPSCNVDGECVLPGKCPRSTQTGCRVQSCPAGQTCVSSGIWDHYCVCDEGCAMNGECHDEDVYFGRKDFCDRNTGGTCMVDDCFAYRNATCSDYMSRSGQPMGTCFCDPPHTCAIDGECVKPGDCPRHASEVCDAQHLCPPHSTCLNPSKQAGEGQCVCDGCALHGECVSRQAYFKAAHAERTAQALASLPDAAAPESRASGVVGIATLSLLATVLVGLRRCRHERRGEGYVDMSDAER